MRTYAEQNVEGVESAATAVQVASSVPRKCQAFVLFILTIQNTALVLVTKISYRKSATPYVVSTVLASAELVKLVLSYFFVGRVQRTKRRPGRAARGAVQRYAPCGSVGAVRDTKQSAFRGR